MTISWSATIYYQVRLPLGQLSFKFHRTKFPTKRCIQLSSSTDTTTTEEKSNDTSSNSTSLKTVDIEDEDEDEEEEWEEVEIENLTEQDFYNSEWLIGTVYNDKTEIEETWVRLTITESENIATWGDGAKGKWAIDVASQFISITKETFGGWAGKKLWAGIMNDYYYLDGTVRGWGFFRSASILGQWQMKRLG